jgi:hypothetical protein
MEQKCDTDRANSIESRSGASVDADRRTVARYILVVEQTRESGILSKRLQLTYVCICVARLHNVTRQYL